MIINTKIQKGKLIIPKDEIERFVKKNGDCDVEIRIEKIKEKRTLAQNNALHLYFTKVAEALNEKGITAQDIIKQDVEMFWTPVMIKELWKKIEKAMYGKSKTSELNKSDEIDRIYDVFNKMLIERTKGEVSVQFPSLETMMAEDYGKY